jgi:hypothetical protein
MNPETEEGHWEDVGNPELPTSSSHEFMKAMLTFALQLR